MQLQTILNRVQKHQSFVYGPARWRQKSHGRVAIEVEIEPRKNGKPLCSGCQQPRPGYDRLPARSFEFVPLLHIALFFIYAMRRVDCPTCGIKVEQVPWAEGKNHLTTTYRWFLARWAKRLSWTEVAKVFGTSWDAVYSAVLMAVVWGLSHRSLLGIEAIGVDEIQWLKGHTYLTLVYDIGSGTKRLLYIGKERTKQSLRTFFQLLKDKGCASLRYVCSDMWQPYLAVIAEKAGHVIHVLDRFHIMKKFNEAIDQVRRDEAGEMKRLGMEPLLRHARWCLLKRPENLNDTQASRLSDLLSYNLNTVTAYLLREEFQRFWEFEAPKEAGAFLDAWCEQALQAELEPIDKVVGMLRSHRELLLNWFEARGQMSSGAVEGMNNKAKIVIRKAYGFRIFRAVEVALYHTLGALPEPQFTHEFC